MRRSSSANKSAAALVLKPPRGSQSSQSASVNARARISSSNLTRSTRTNTPVGLDDRRSSSTSREPSSSTQQQLKKKGSSSSVVEPSSNYTVFSAAAGHSASAEDAITNITMEVIPSFFNVNIMN